MNKTDEYFLSTEKENGTNTYSNKLENIKNKFFMLISHWKNNPSVLFNILIIFNIILIPNIFDDYVWSNTELVIFAQAFLICTYGFTNSSFSK